MQISLFINFCLLNQENQTNILLLTFCFSFSSEKVCYEHCEGDRRQSAVSPYTVCIAGGRSIRNSNRYKIISAAVIGRTGVEHPDFCASFFKGFERTYLNIKLDYSVVLFDPIGYICAESYHHFLSFSSCLSNFSLILSSLYNINAKTLIVTTTATIYTLLGKRTTPKRKEI